MKGIAQAPHTRRGIRLARINATLGALFFFDHQAARGEAAAAKMRDVGQRLIAAIRVSKTAQTPASRSC
jgi:hypothetical protein